MTSITQLPILKQLELQAMSEYATTVVDIITIGKFAKLKNNGIYNYYDGMSIKLTDTNKVVIKDLYVCQACRLKTTYAVITVNNNAYTEYYNVAFYTHDQRNSEFLSMTKDHIVPKSLGGSNNKSNFQALCYRCNQEKANSIDDAENGTIDLTITEIVNAVKGNKAYLQLTKDLDEFIINMPWYLKMLNVDKIIKRIVRESN